MKKDSDPAHRNSLYLWAVKALSRLNPYFWKYRNALLLGVVFTVISNLFAIYPAQVIREIVDIVVDNLRLSKAFAQSPLQPALNEDLITLSLLAAGIVIGLSLLKGIFLFLVRQTIIVVSRHVEYDLKNDLYAHYQKLDLTFYKLHSTGDLMNRISEDVSRVRMYIGPALMYGINLLVLTVLVIYTMIRVNPVLTAYVLIPLPLLSIAVYFVNTAILKKSEQVQQKLSGLSSLVQEAFSGIRILKVYNRLPYMEGEMEKQAGAYQKENLGLITINAIFFPLIMLLIGLSTLIAVYVGGFHVADGKITPGVIAEFIIYVNLLTWPVASLGWVTSIVQRAAASQIRINDFLDRTPDITWETQSNKVSVAGDIQFKNVSYTYPETGIQAIHSLNLHIPAGATVAITGRTGSGKSTLAQLLLRFFDPTEGQILVDGKDVKLWDLGHLRNQMGYVPQEVFLFSDSIANNISFGFSGEEVDQKKTAWAAKQAHIHDNIMGFPEQYQTKVGERGITLSGGQKQRVSIARALLRNPSILVLDDCLSAVDTETEEIIMHHLRELMKNKTSLFISHRISAVRHADIILVIEEGQIVEKGNHAALMERQGLYFERYHQQLSETSGKIN